MFPVSEQLGGLEARKSLEDLREKQPAMVESADDQQGLTLLEKKTNWPFDVSQDDSTVVQDQTSTLTITMENKSCGDTKETPPAVKGGGLAYTEKRETFINLSHLFLLEDMERPRLVIDSVYHDDKWPREERFSFVFNSWTSPTIYHECTSSPLSFK